jgi:hypothetical protein
MKLLIALSASASILLTNCASIVSKSSYPVTINSNPQGLSFVVTDVKTNSVISTGKSPQQVTLKASAGYFKPATYRIDVKKGSRVTASQEITATLDGWFFGNILLGGLIGMLIVDPLTGAMYKLPNEVTVGSTAVAGIQESTRSLQIVSIDTLTPAQRKQLVKI